jgi:hypothetical protein
LIHSNFAKLIQSHDQIVGIHRTDELQAKSPILAADDVCIDWTGFAVRPAVPAFAIYV